MIALMLGMAKAAIAILTICALAASPAQAAFPGQNGKIAFSTAQLEGNHEIYVVEPDGSGLTRLTESAGIDMEPAWSPDGRRIAFTSARDAGDPTCLSQGFHCDLDVYVMNADGSRVTRLTDHPGRDTEPAWSPDGTKIAFTTTRDHEGPFPFGSDAFNMELYVMNADGSSETRITTFPFVDKHAAWSPDGARIAFFRGNCGFNCTSHIYTAAPDGSDVAQLTFGQFVRDRLPDWSPDGSRLVFNRDAGDNRFWLVNRDGSGATSIFAPRLEPAWSPDGTRIAHGGLGIGHQRLDGSDPRLVFGSGTLPDWQPLVGPRRSDFKNRPAFCRAEREFLGEARFGAVYGTFGGCVSSS